VVGLNYFPPPAQAVVSDVVNSIKNEPERRLDYIEQRMEYFDKQFGYIDQRIKNIDQRIGNTNDRIETTNKRVENINRRIESNWNIFGVDPFIAIVLTLIAVSPLLFMQLSE
jgi:hypothetical protein